MRVGGRGCQKPFGVFPENHSFWRKQTSCIPNFQLQHNAETLKKWLNVYANMQICCNFVYVTVYALYPRAEGILEVGTWSKHNVIISWFLIRKAILDKKNWIFEEKSQNGDPLFPFYEVINFSGLSKKRSDSQQLVNKMWKWSYLGEIIVISGKS